MKIFSKILGGQGQDLVILHGLFGMSDNWMTLGKHFSEHFKVHLIDLRNHGRSPHSTDFDYNVMQQDLLEYIVRHKIKPIILGHSLGGKLAMSFAFTFPERIAKLIVVDIAPREYDTSFHRKLLGVLQKISLENVSRREDVDKELSSFFNDKALRLFLLKNLYRQKDKQFSWRFNLKVLLEKIDNIRDASFIQGSCNINTLFIKGDRSNYILCEDELIINTHFTNFTISTIKGAGHWLHAEKPQQVYDEVTTFCLSK